MASQASAQVIWSNAQPDHFHGSEMTHWIDADDFLLDQPARLQSIKFWEFEAVPGAFAASVTWQIYSDTGSGKPAQQLYSGTSINLNRISNGIIADYAEHVTTFDLPPISLPPGRYWLALHNGPLSYNSAKDLFWEAAVSAIGYASQQRVVPFTGAWSPNSPPDLAFEIHGVPFPRVTGLAAGNGASTISFTTSAGYAYRVDYKDSLSDGSWKPLAGADAIPGNGDIVQVADLDPNLRKQPRRFYRVGFSYSGAGAPSISALGLTAGGAQISFKAAAGYYYRVEFKDNLQDSSWSPLQGADMISGTGNVVQITDPDVNTATPTQRFYRVILF